MNYLEVKHEGKMQKDDVNASDLYVSNVIKFSSRV